MNLYQSGRVYSKNLIPLWQICALFYVVIVLVQFSFKMAQTSALSWKLAGQPATQKHFSCIYWYFIVFYRLEVTGLILSIFSQVKSGWDQLKWLCQIRSDEGWIGGLMISGEIRQKQVIRWNQVKAGDQVKSGWDQLKWLCQIRSDEGWIGGLMIPG